MKALAFLLGVITLYAWPVLPPLSTGLLIIPALLARFTVPHGSLVTTFGLGFLLALGHAHWRCVHQLPDLLDGETVTLTGVVASIPEVEGRRTRFLFEVDQRLTQDERQAMPMRVRLSWFESDVEISAGERWQFDAKLKQPRGFSNPGGFDYETWLYRSGIDATGYVRNTSKAVRLNVAQALSLNALRQSTWQKLQLQLQDRPMLLALVPALTLGVRQDMDRDMWSVFRATGTSHLMAISGLHIGIVAGLCYWLGFQCWRLCTRCSLRLASMRAAALVALGGASVYALMAGLSVPTQRALVMLAVVMLAQLAGRKIKPANILFAALVGVLLLDTAAVLSPGFWLSFGAVLVILLGMERSHILPRWQQFIALQLLLSVVFVPLTAWFFGEASLVSPLANLVAVPVMTLLVVPLALLLTGLSLIPVVDTGWLVASLDTILHGLYAFLHWLSEWRFSRWTLPAISLPRLLISLLPLWVFMRLRAPWRWWMPMASLVVLLIPGNDRPEPSAMRIAFLDVGQGLSVVVETARHTLVYDLGPRFGDSFDAASAVVEPYLLYRGVSRLDRLVISHEDLDHRGALAKFMSEVEVEEVAVGAGVDWPGATQCRAGEAWQWEGVSFEFLHPTMVQSVEDNDQSCVLKVTAANGVSLLLTGDITRVVEQSLADSHGEQLDVDILQVPHHGSRTSSSEAFIAATQPALAVATLGYRNRWGFPRPDVVGRYRQAGVEFLRTDETGAVIIDVPAAASGYHVTLWRDQARRFWKADKITD